MTTTPGTTHAESTPAADDRERHRQWTVRVDSPTYVAAVASREAAMWNAEHFPHLVPVTRLPGEQWQDARPAPTGPGEYTVTWTHDAIDADSPEDAARQALETHRDPGSIACVYNVSRADGTSRAVEIDLNTPEQVNGPIRERPLPVDPEQLTDEMLTRLREEISRVQSARLNATLPPAVAAAWAADHTAAPTPPVHIDFHRKPDNDTGAPYWAAWHATAVFPDGTDMPWDAFAHQDVTRLLDDHADQWEPSDDVTALRVTLTPPGVATVCP